MQFKITFPMQVQRRVYANLLNLTEQPLDENQRLFIETWLAAPRKTRQVFRKLRRKAASLLPLDAMSIAITRTVPEGKRKKAKPNTAPSKPYNTTREQKRRRRQDAKRNKN